MSQKNHAPTATTRLGLLPAPAGLSLVQDLLNTRDIGGKVPDLLATIDDARAWLRSTLTGFEDETTDAAWVSGLTERDLTALRSCRADLLRLVTGVDGAAAVRVAASATLVVAPGGALRLEPGGTGRQRFLAGVWCEVFLAQRADGFKRLKTCGNPPCSSAFYDRSKNNSGVWHDVKTCGNSVNLRASRARKRLV